jgi:hypothetical protein
MTNTELATRAQAVARALTYNDDKPQAQAKHLLLECSHRLDSLSVRAHKKADGLLLVDARGKARYATWRERLAYWIAGTLPAEV